MDKEMDKNPDKELENDTLNQADLENVVGGVRSRTICPTCHRNYLHVRFQDDGRRIWYCTSCRYTKLEDKPAGATGGW